ncbi:hypothetical protein [Streptomyces prasinopilosus]|uniref:Uncharacterized protein n=1 Tax=Streptomyces prasinopilosus TaxID=67344 RepID=A0A1G6Q8V3_9ACTN|nr:hypothetical protein [Streptomyces prasinopilosus]SDC88334.1 hypothetical protein SAMN05216505_10413 [Streptomyces prasinopilosus]
MAEGRPVGIEASAGDDDTVRIRAIATPGPPSPPDRRKRDAFVLGVRAGEFDHFAVRS